MPDWRTFIPLFQLKHDPALVDRAVNRLEHGDVVHTKYGARVALRPDLDDNREATGSKAYWPEHACLCYYNKANHTCSHRIAVEIFRVGDVSPAEVELTLAELSDVPPVLVRQKQVEKGKVKNQVDETSTRHALWRSQGIYTTPGLCNCLTCKT